MNLSSSNSRRLAGVAALALMTTGLAACGGGGDSGATGATGATATVNPSPLMLVTVSGIGTAQMGATVKSLGDDPGAGGSVTTPDAKAGTGTLAANGLDMIPIEERSFDVGTAGSGTRYFYTTFKVRNARFCGTAGSCAPYAGARHNLTLVPVATAATMTTTPFTQFTTAGGTPALPSYATQTLPTHGMAAASDGSAAVKPGLESLQLFGEDEIQAWPTVPGSTTTFPYGFVVHSDSSSASRELAGNPGPGSFGGLVTVAFRMPLAATASQNPTTVSFVLAAIDDAGTRVSQSPEEASAAGDQAGAARAQPLMATDLATVGTRVANTDIGDPQCAVRSAGTASVPTAYLIGPNSNPTTANTLRAAPSFLTLAPTAPLRLGFCQAMAKPTPTTLVVSGSVSGPRTLATAATPTATWGLDRASQLLVTPAAGKPFAPGETVSYTLLGKQATASGGTVGTSFVGSYLVGGLAASPGQLSSGTDLSVSGGGTSSSAFLPHDAVMADFNGDGTPDIAAADNNTSNNYYTPAGTPSLVTIIYGNPAKPGTLGSRVFVDTGDTASAIATADFNADGIPDLVVTNPNLNSVSVLMGSASTRGFFAAKVDYPTGTDPQSIAIADFNADGLPDLAVANDGYNTNTVSVLLNTPASPGTFQAKTDYATGSTPMSVATGDFNNDGYPDLAVANNGSSTVSVLLNNQATLASLPAAAQGLLGGQAFQAKVDYPVGNSPGEVVAADLNGDGLADLAVNVSNISGYYYVPAISVLTGNAKSPGTFNAQVAYPVSGGNYTSVAGLAAGDLNGDGALDLALLLSPVYAYSTGGSVMVMPGSTSAPGTFSSGNTYNYTASAFNNGNYYYNGASYIKLGDFNHDNKLDVIVPAPDGVDVLTNM